MKFIKSLLVILALALVTAACDGPVGPQGDGGPQGEQGERGARGPAGEDGTDGQDGERGPRGPVGQDGQDGEDGNANVTSYVFPGYDSSAGIATRRISLEGESEVDESAWLHYFVYPNGIFVQVPGPGYDLSSVYEIDRLWIQSNNAAEFRFYRTGGSGETIANIVIIQIEGSASVECPDPSAPCSGLRATSESLIPADLDVSDYHAVVEYYGLTEDDTVRL